MKITTPSEAIEKLQYFINAVNRLEADQYTLPRLRTADMNRLKNSYARIQLYASIAKFNKNQKRANAIIDLCRQKHLKAYDLIEWVEVPAIEKNHRL